MADRPRKSVRLKLTAPVDHYPRAVAHSCGAASVFAYPNALFSA